MDLRKPENSPPRFTVIIPAYERFHLLKRAVASVIFQVGIHPTQWECHIIDDGSSAVDPDWIRECQSHPSCFYHRYRSNRGVSWARNQGFRFARGEWVLFLDSDDEWLPNKLQEVEAFLTRSSSLRVFQNDEIWIRGGRRVNPHRHHLKKAGDIFLESLARCMVTTSSAVVHRSVLKKYRWDESLPACEDYDLWLRVAADFPVGLLPKKLTIRYQDHGFPQLSKRYSVMDRFRIQALKKFIKQSSVSQSRLAKDKFNKKVGIVLAGAWKRKRLWNYLVVLMRYRVWGILTR